MAALDILILALLSKGPAHGYNLKKRVETAMGGALSLNNKVLYPALRRFQEMGAVTSELVPQEGSPPRRVFSMTEAGIDVLRDMLEDFSGGLVRSPAEFQVRFVLFDMLPAPARLALLERRRAVVQRDLDHLDPAFLEMASARWGDGHVERLLDLFRRQAAVELSWLDEQRRLEQEGLPGVAV
jgi:DNA-binding PadR family transcriptional regulator